MSVYINLPPISPNASHPTSHSTSGSLLTKYYQQPHEYNYCFSYESVCSHSWIGTYQQPHPQKRVIPPLSFH